MIDDASTREIFDAERGPEAELRKTLNNAVAKLDPAQLMYELGYCNGVIDSTIALYHRKEVTRHQIVNCLYQMLDVGLHQGSKEAFDATIKTIDRKLQDIEGDNPRG